MDRVRISIMTMSCVLLLDEPRKSPEYEGAADLIVLWTARSRPGSRSDVVCLADKVETAQGHLRALYLSWLESVPQTRTSRGTVEEVLRIRPDLSYWWMTLPAAFPFSEDSAVLPAVKLLALDILLRERGVSRLQVSGGSRALRESIARLASNTGLTLDFIGPVARSPGPRLALTRAIGSTIRYVLVKSKPILHRRRVDVPPTRSNGIVVVDYLGPYESASLGRGAFLSRYWGALVDGLNKGAGAVWLHRRVSGTTWPPERSSNPSTPIGGLHSDVTEPSGFNTKLLGARDYVRIAWRSRTVAKIPGLFLVPGTGVDLWPLLRDSWMRSFIGANSIHEMTWLAAIEKRISGMPHQALCVYLMENQPWELSLVSAWRRAGHGRTVGFAHSTVRTWDLRYAVSGLAIKASSQYCPVPDVIAVNGLVARRTMVEFSVPAERLFDVEAVRFAQPLQPPEQPPKSSETSPTKVLVLGEYWPSAARRQIDLIGDAGADDSVVYSFRPHPASPSVLSPSDPLTLVPATEPLSQWLSECDAVLVGETSSVAVDALGYSRPLAILADPAVLPTNPLRGLEGVPVLRSPADLADWISTLSRAPVVGAQRAALDEFFTLDPSLNRWTTLLHES